MNDAVVSIGAGRSQLLIIKKAKEMGFSVIGVDKNPNAPGFAFCDERIELSTYEAQPIIEAILRVGKSYKLRGVLNRSSGIPVVTCFEICRSLSLPGVPPEAARIIIDKSKLIPTCSNLGISTPDCYPASLIDDVNVSNLCFPCIVKPALSLVGKSGVRKVSNEKELPMAFEHARKTSLNGVVNIEEFVPGRDISLMAVVYKGKVYPIILLDELNMENEAGELSGIGFAVPSVFSGRPEEERLISLAQEIVSSFKLETTIFNMSCRCDFEGTPKLIEIHLDFGGDLILDTLIPNSTSFDVLEFAIHALTGKEPRPVQGVFDPTAIIYDKSDGLISERSYTILKGEERHELENTIASISR